MKVIKVTDGKVVCVSVTSVRPSDDSWKIVDDNAEYFVGQEVDGVGEKRGVADVQSLIKAVAETEELLNQKKEELVKLSEEYSLAKAAQQDLVGKLSKQTEETNALRLRFESLSDSVQTLLNALAERRHMADVATEELLKAKAEAASRKAYEEAMAKAKAELTADVLKKGPEKNEKVSGSAQKNIGGTKTA